MPRGSALVCTSISWKGRGGHACRIAGFGCETTRQSAYTLLPPSSCCTHWRRYGAPCFRPEPPDSGAGPAVVLRDHLPPRQDQQRAPHAGGGCAAGARALPHAGEEDGGRRRGGEVGTNSAQLSPRSILPPLFFRHPQIVPRPKNRPARAPITKFRVLTVREPTAGVIGAMEKAEAEAAAAANVKGAKKPGSAQGRSQER
jgi:hypothetical protein